LLEALRQAADSVRGMPPAGTAEAWARLAARGLVAEKTRGPGAAGAAKLDSETAWALLHDLGLVPPAAGAGADAAPPDSPHPDAATAAAPRGDAVSPQAPWLALIEALPPTLAERLLIEQMARLTETA
jgi:hypothetical protein